MPEFYSQAAADAGEGLDEFTKAYIECLYFTDSGENFDPDAEENEGQFHPESPLSKEARDKCKDDCKLFQSANRKLLKSAYKTGYTPEQAGHDFWLTRNGHGLSYLDRELGSVGEKLDKVAKVYGCVWPYQSEEGKVCL